MAELHKNFNNEQVRAILRNYVSGQMDREKAQEILSIGKCRFFILLKEYRTNPTEITITYGRKTPGRISTETDSIIRQELEREKVLILEADDVDPQWRQALRLLNVGVTYALSPQAKVKIERSYRWLQDRIVRTCALEGISSLQDARTILKLEVDR